MTDRPRLDSRLSGAELRRWYWLHSELTDLARSLGVSPTGGKIALTDRLADALDGLPAPAAARSSRAPRLTGTLTDDTVIPPRQSCSQHLRAYFVDRVGPGFRFDAAMRGFIATGAGRTLGEGVEHWRATRADPPADIGPQFELNRFARAWHQTHPSGSRAALLTAWSDHRALPVEQRLASDPPATRVVA